jgi:hypothetical protein
VQLSPRQKGRAPLVGESLKPPLTAPTYHFRWDSAGRGKAGEDRDCTGALARERLRNRVALGLPPAWRRNTIAAEEAIRLWGAGGSCDAPKQALRRRSSPTGSPSKRKSDYP